MSHSPINPIYPQISSPAQHPEAIDSAQTPSDVLKDLQEISQDKKEIESILPESQPQHENIYPTVVSSTEFESIPLTPPSQYKQHDTLPKQNISQNQSTNTGTLTAFNKALAFGKAAFFASIGVISTGLAIISPLTSLFGTALFVFASLKQTGSNLDDRDTPRNLPATIAQYTGAIIALPVTIAILSFNKAVDT